MTLRRLMQVGTLMVSMFTLSHVVQAQTPGAVPPTPPAAPAVPTPAVPATPDVPVPPVPPVPDDDFDAGADDRDIVRIGQNYSLRATERVGDVVVIRGDVTLDGHVEGDVVVVLGTLRVGSTAVLERELTVIGGDVTIAPGAEVERELVVVGGTLSAPDRFEAGQGQVVIDPSLLGMRVGAAVPWLTRGPAMGRLIVPGLSWVWAVVAVFFFLYLVIGLVAEGPVTQAATEILEKPLTAFGAGLLVLALLGPVCLLLAMSVVGIPIIPVLLCAVLVAGLVGKVGVLRWAGLSLLRRSTTESGAAGLLAIALGFALLTVAYSVPVLGLVTWALLGVLSLGAAALALLAAYQREHPPSPAPPPMPPVPPVPSDVGPALEGGSLAAAVPPVPPGLSGLANFPRAPFRDRLGAAVLDVFLVLLAVSLLGPFRPPRSFFLGWLVYHVVFWAWKQTTVGGIICHLRIVRAGSATLSFADAMVRGLSSLFSMAVAGLGFLWILKEPDRQAWHDKIAGTYVVKVPQDWPV